MNMDFHLATWLRLVTLADLSTRESLGVLKTNPVSVSVSKKSHLLSTTGYCNFALLKPHLK